MHVVVRSAALLEHPAVSVHPQLQLGLKQGVFWITKRIAIGQFASERRCEWLLQQGVTHILNVADADTTEAARRAEFRDVVAVPVVDLALIPIESVVRCLDFIDEAMSAPDSKLYLHCIAGQNRSPTILWLFLLATGMDADQAKRLIVERCPDAVPGHAALVDEVLIAEVRAHGRKRKTSEHDEAVTAPAY